MLGARATTPLSTTATKASARSGWVRPSRCLQLAFLALTISVYLAVMGGGVEVDDPRIAPLLARGWTIADRAPCPDLREPGFYEVESDSDTREFFFAGENKVFSSGAWPEPPSICRPIPHPGFVQEIL